MRNFIKLGSIVGIAWFAAAALTPLTSVAIRNSTIDSTAIGNSNATTVRSTYLQSTTTVPSTLPTQGLYTAWNFSGGDADFFNHPGLGLGGFNWFQSNSSGNSSVKLMGLSNTGALSVTALSANAVVAGAQYPTGVTGVNGSWLNWDQTLSLGETDFINQHQSGPGGFNWYSTTSTSSPGSPIATLSGTGDLSVRSLTASVGLTGSLNGNAATASAFNHTPTACSIGFVASGVVASGNAVCVPMVQSAAGPGGVTGSSTYSTTSSIAVLNPGYADNAYQATCTLVGPSDPRAYIYGITKTSTQIRVLVTTGGSIAISYAGVDCLVKHN